MASTVFRSYSCLLGLQRRIPMPFSLISVQQRGLWTLATIVSSDQSSVLVIAFSSNVALFSCQSALHSACRSTFLILNHSCIYNAATGGTNSYWQESCQREALDEWMSRDWTQRDSDCTGWRPMQCVGGGGGGPSFLFLPPSFCLLGKTFG